MGNSISRNSYLLAGPCSAREVIWHYVNETVLPEQAQCIDYNYILESHCCKDLTCRPNKRLDQEFHRYMWDDWWHLGNPFAGSDRNIEWSGIGGCTWHFKGGNYDGTEPGLYVLPFKRPKPSSCSEDFSEGSSESSLEDP
ncbi:hypothetical protein GLAREA_03252 [Glarea lozoyensis ATCC 20868]|uniref:Uncharacterized protein n=1 Tax=Glarea lozoyensis (strain ATCC 20868 / MF5171) TaxID=1116229 RepID=S3CLI7_GLAL2|nr:uncharacterized protein GLAREA_03252 [Glarea lozoyensis ATCC 20868]EPE27337.1 hypothetical protein GLAREA_03252 [Glarea lozoyensis ATCC 20868]